MKRIESFKPKMESSAKAFNGRAKIQAMYKRDEWVKFSRRFLEINNKCYACGQPSEVTDHLTPHRGDEKLFCQPDNMIPLCCKCHNIVTARFDRNGGAKNLNTKLQWLFNNRVRNEISIKVKVIPYLG